MTEIANTGWKPLTNYKDFMASVGSNANPAANLRGNGFTSSVPAPAAVAATPVATAAATGGWTDLTGGFNTAPAVAQGGAANAAQVQSGSAGFTTPGDKVTPPSNEMSFADKWGIGLDAAKFGVGAFLGYQSYKIGKDTLNQQKLAFNTNLEEQRLNQIYQADLQYDKQEAMKKGSTGMTKEEYRKQYGSSSTSTLV